MNRPEARPVTLLAAAAIAALAGCQINDNARSPEPHRNRTGSEQTLNWKSTGDGVIEIGFGERKLRAGAFSPDSEATPTSEGEYKWRDEATGPSPATGNDDDEPTDPVPVSTGPRLVHGWVWYYRPLPFVYTNRVTAGTQGARLPCNDNDNDNGNGNGNGNGNSRTVTDHEPTAILVWKYAAEAGTEHVVVFNFATDGGPNIIVCVTGASAPVTLTPGEYATATIGTNGAGQIDEPRSFRDEEWPPDSPAKEFYDYFKSIVEDPSLTGG